jgi:hypothetical protein
LSTQLSEARALLQVFADHFEGECRLDHEGYCQAHLLEEDCSVAKARELLSRPPSGKWVARDPTTRMREAGDIPGTRGPGHAEDVWHAMYDAAP